MAVRQTRMDPDCGVIFSLRADPPRVRLPGGTFRGCGCRSPAGRQAPPESRCGRHAPARVRASRPTRLALVPVADGLQPQTAAWRPQVDDPGGGHCRARRYDLRGVPGGVAWCVSGRGYAPPSDTPRGLFPNSLMSTGTKTGEGSRRHRWAYSFLGRITRPLTPKSKRNTAPGVPSALMLPVTNN